MRGYLYVLSNRAMPGLLKIGYTTRTLKERIAELSSTGVPSRFEIEFYCEVEHAANFESAIHSQLHNRRFEKEFFRCTTAEAVKNVKLVAGSGEHIIHSSGGRAASAFLTKDEQEQANRLAEHKRREVAEAQRQYELKIAAKAARAKQIQEIERRVMPIASKADAAIRPYFQPSLYKGVKSAIGIAAFFTVVGIPLTNVLHPPLDVVEGKIAKKLACEARSLFTELFAVLLELRSVTGIQMKVNYDAKAVHVIQDFPFPTAPAGGGCLYMLSTVVLAIFRELGLDVKRLI